MKRVFLILIALIGFGISVHAQKKVKTINVIPDNAKIMIGGMEVATGQYLLTFKKQDYIVLKLTADGYVERTVRIYKSDKGNTFTFKLEIDDSFAASEINSDLANRSFQVTTKRGPDEVWKRLIYYVTEAFPQMEITDKSAGWIRSGWEFQSFPTAGVTIRTRIEIKEVPGMEILTYKVMLQSEYASSTCGRGDQCFRKWDRVLKRYIKLVEDLRNSLN